MMKNPSDGFACMQVQNERLIISMLIFQIFQIFLNIVGKSPSEENYDAVFGLSHFIYIY